MVWFRIADQSPPPVGLVPVPSSLGSVRSCESPVSSLSPVVLAGACWYWTTGGGCTYVTAVGVAAADFV
jgi:hypothetical protein